MKTKKEHPRIAKICVDFLQSNKNYFLAQNGVCEKYFFLRLDLLACSVQQLALVFRTRSCFGLFALQIVDSGYLRFKNLEKLDLSALLAVLFEFTQITASYYFIHIIFIG